MDSKELFVEDILIAPPYKPDPGDSDITGETVPVLKTVTAPLKLLIQVTPRQLPITPFTDGPSCSQDFYSK